MSVRLSEMFGNREPSRLTIWFPVFVLVQKDFGRAVRQTSEIFDEASFTDNLLWNSAVRECFFREVKYCLASDTREKSRSPREGVDFPRRSSRRRRGSCLCQSDVL